MLIKKRKEFLCTKCGSQRERRIKIELNIFPGNTMCTYKELLVLLGRKKKAKTRECYDCGAIEVTCPFCQQKTIQDEEIRNYICPYCYKKSYANTSFSLATLLMKKQNDI
jgi:ribosomal protein L37AE/L43A